MCRDKQSTVDMLFFSFFFPLYTSDWQKRTLFFTLSRTTRGVRREQKEKTERRLLTRRKKIKNRTEREKRKKSVTQRHKTKKLEGEAKIGVFLCVAVLVIFFHDETHRKRHSQSKE